jgi:sulfite exporter TauE/SafE
MILFLLEIAFVLFFLGLLAKALVETVWGIILIVTGLMLLAGSYIWQFLTYLGRRLANLTLFLSPAKRRRMKNLNAARALGRACLGRRP